MTTSRPRHAITETPEIAAAINSGVAFWADLPTRAAVLRRLVLAGAEAISQKTSERAAARRIAVSKWAGSMPGVFPPGAIEELHREWPE